LVYTIFLQWLKDTGTIGGEYWPKPWQTASPDVALSFPAYRLTIAVAPKPELFRYQMVLTDNSCYSLKMSHPSPTTGAPPEVSDLRRRHVCNVCLVGLFPRIQSRVTWEIRNRCQWQSNNIIIITMILRIDGACAKSYCTHTTILWRITRSATVPVSSRIYEWVVVYRLGIYIVISRVVSEFTIDGPAPYGLRFIGCRFNTSIIYCNIM